MVSIGHRGRRFFWFSVSLWLPLAPAVLTAQAKNEIAATRDFNANAQLQNLGSYERAETKWQEFIKAYPKDKRLDRVHYYLGYCRLRNKKYDEAAAAFRTVLSQYKSFTKADGAQFYLGRALYEKAKASAKPADLTAAADALGVVAKNWPQSGYVHKALFYQGDALATAENHQPAIAALTTLVNKHPDGQFLARGYYNLGVAQQALDQADEATKTFRAFLDRKEFAEDELRPEVQLRLGMVLYSQKQYAEAEKQFAAASQKKDSPYADLGLYRQGLCRVEAGNLNGAVQLFNQLLKQSPDGPYAAGGRLAAGKCYFLIDQPDMAQKTLQPLASSKSPEAAEGTYWLGRTLRKMAKPAEAVALLDQAVKTHNTGEFAPYLQFARLNAMHDIPQRRAETAKLYAEFLTQFPDHPLAAQALYMASLAALEQKDYAAARQYAEQFLTNQELTKSDLAANVIFLAAESHLLALDAPQQPGDPAAAEALYRKLVQEHPEHAKVPRAHLRIALLLDRAKKYDEVVSYLNGVASKLKEPALQAEAHLLSGRAHNDAGRAKEAVTALQKALQVKGDWQRTDEVLLELADCQRKLKDDKQAAAHLQQLVASHPQSPFRGDAIFLLGELFRTQSQFDEAINQYNQLVSQFPKSPFAAAAHYGLATSYLAKNDDKNAATALAKLLASDGDPAIMQRGRYARAIVLLRQKKFAEALADLNTFLAAKPSPAEALDARFSLVLCQIGQKQFDPAHAALSKLLQEDAQHPKAASVCYDLGHALLEADQADRAAATFEMLAQRCPDSPLAGEAWFRVGSFHEQLAGDAADAEKAQLFSKAAAAFAAGIKAAENADIKEKLQYKLGDMQFQQAQYAEAAATLQAMIQEHPKAKLVGPARFLAAESLFRADQFEPALPLYLQVVTDKVQPVQANALYRAGTCAGNLRRWPESQKHYETLINQFKDFPQIHDARYGLGWALQNQNKLDEAIAAYERVTADSESEAAAKSRFMIGEIAFGRGNHEEAIEHYVKVSVGYPYEQWQAMAQFETARCLQQLNRKQQAITTLEQMVAKFPDHPKSKDAQQLIAELKK